jgi:hypothetical protein
MCFYALIFSLDLSTLGETSNILEINDLRLENKFYDRKTDYLLEQKSRDFILDGPENDVLDDGLYLSKNGALLLQNILTK